VVGASGTIRRTTNGGATWTGQSSGITNTLYSVSFTDANTGKVVGGEGTILHTATGGTTWVQENGLIPATFVLEQNFPNPFNPSTKIRYQILRAGPVTLKVFDLLGREVAALVHERLSPGTYVATFDAGDLAAGAYLYRLQGDGFVQTKRLVLLR
jgi:hypothetical protein